MIHWYQPFKSPFFLSGVILNAMLAFPLLWAARNLDSRVWLPIVIAMIGVGACQAAFVLVSLFLAEPPAPLIITDIPLVELEPIDNSSSNEDNSDEQ